VIHTARRDRARAGALAVALLGALAAAATLPPSGSGQAGGNAGPLPVLGAADSEMVLMGAAPAVSETWGYRRLPLSIGAITFGGRNLEFGSPPRAGGSPQLAFLRHTAAGGWQIAETPRNEQDRPYRGPVPNRLSARTTPNGGGVLVGRDTARVVASQLVVLHRNPGDNFRAITGPPPDVLLPGEALAEDNGSGAIAVAAVDEGPRTGLFFGPVGLPAENAVIHFDGQTWTREPVDVPPGSEADFRITALAASGPGEAWALARTAPGLGRGIVLFQRTTGPGGPRWVERPLGSSPFATRDSGAAGTANVAALTGSADPLAVTPDGVWVDGTVDTEGATRDFTLYYDSDSRSVTGSWCDASACGRRLNAKLARSIGYRSFAWAGSGFGTRVITNPLDPGGNDQTNRGTYLRFGGETFERRPGGGGNFRPSGAFAGPDDGWLEGPVQISSEAPLSRLRSYPAALRAPLGDVTPQPGAARGALGSRALAAGLDGGIARYFPDRGWTREFLTSSSGSVSKASLRGVAWPEADRAHAVGDLGAMWQWNADNDLWEPDPGAPVGFEGNLMDVAFEPGSPDRGYAVGKGGVLLRYDKSWEQEVLPPGYEGRDLTQVTFAGSQAIVAAGGDLLVNDAGSWRVDGSAKALLDGVRAGNPQLFAVAGRPDGGAVAAGRDIVLERDGAGSPWRFSDQPLPGSTVVAAAALRAGGRVRAIVSVVPQLDYPSADDIPEQDPNEPPPLLPPFQLPGDGYVLRETDGGWADDQRTSFSGSGDDRPIKSDPILSFVLDDSGNGWAVGGWSGDADSAGRGSSARNPAGRANRTRVRTAGLYRYGADAGTPPPASGSSPVPTPSGPVRLAVAGHAKCELPCADLAPQALGPDQTVLGTLGRLAGIRGGNGPRALLYTGGRAQAGLTEREAGRYASLLGSQPSLPVYPAVGSGDSGGSGAAAFRSAFAGFNSPFGAGGTPSGVSASGIPGAGPGPGARTHYAFDSDGPGGRVRIVVIDNSLGSLAASDPHQNPSEPQRPWLISVLADAKAKGIATVVMGSRDLNTRFSPRLNTASDGDDTARLLVAGGASAYVFDRPEEQRSYRVPSGGADTIPSFGTGTMGYRSPISGVFGGSNPDALFGDTGYLMLEIDSGRRNPATNRAPASARLIPVVEDLSLEATDGTLLRRSRPSLFRGLGRRPRGGDRWGRAAAGDGNPDPPGGDPYTNFPPDPCVIAGCSARIAPEYEFTSSDPDIADFVRQDPNSTNLRKPFLDGRDRVVTDGRSSLLCTFNAGTTTVTVRAGGFSFSQQIRVLNGSVLRPCGTRPLNPSRFRRNQPGSVPTPTPPPGPAPPADPAPTFSPPPPAVAASAPVAAPPPAPVPPPARPPAIPPSPPAAFDAPLPPGTIDLASVPTIPPPPPPPAIRPLPPGGAPGRVYQVEEKREEEAAPEQSQAFSRYEPDGGGSPTPWLLGLVLIAALAGASVRGSAGPRSRPRTRRVTAAPARTGSASPPEDFTADTYDHRRRPPGGPRP